MENSIGYLFSSLEPGFVLLSVSIFMLLMIMVIYFRRVMSLLRPSSWPGRSPMEMIQWVQEAEQLYEGLSKIIEERREIAERLIGQLDARIEALRSMQKDLDRFEAPIAEEVSPKGSEDEILRMAREGKDFSEIAQETGLSVGAVRFIMNLKRYEESPSFQRP